MTHRAEEAQLDLDYQFAYNYVNRVGLNGIKAYELLCKENNIEYTAKFVRTQAAKYMKKEKVKKWITELKAENASKREEAAEINFSMLLDMATDNDASYKDRMAAIKEINAMCGFNASNINVKGDIDTNIEVVIE